ncbi:hypothetical protein B0T22DRAFT_511897 [Podospora appendiculata]|uniref:DUF2415 domain-containing protein n=1 Tax=Podospora appendiculata TaxID=314037 RepID=A0AAE0X9A9_9PEZI|nr:hypothetical protein B0T22DRAFT_511897 [Podospora appendiculata]
MAVKDDDVFHPTEDLILSKPRRHYRTQVRVAHWQLRSLLGAEKSNLVYFPTGAQSLNIQQLNTTTHETEIIRRLPFQPRCLVAQNGWVCCGGETGEFAAIRVGDRSTPDDDDDDDLDAPLNLDPDDRLPLNLDPSRPEDSILSTLSRSRSIKNLLARSMKFGRERVNCVTLWFPPTVVPPYEGAYNQPVAVLANNDKSVAIVSLQDQDCLEDVAYPDCVNRAVISPDGQLLVAVCDDPYLYIHERVKKPRGNNAFSTSHRAIYEWNLCRKIHLKSQSKDDRSDNKGSFAICFSSTGRYLAVGTQYGTISVFDVPSIAVLGVDPLITWFNSTRNGADRGAVRDMAFAPGSVDLLAWTEDRSRVGIVDLRSGFSSRQILHLDREDEYEHHSVTSRSPIDHAFLDYRNERSDPLLSTFANSRDVTPRDVRQSRRPDLLESGFHVPLSAEETLVLEALSEQRRRRENRPPAAGGATGPRQPWAERNNRGGALANDVTRSRERSASMTRAVSDILGTIRDQRERMRDTQERLRIAMRDDRGGSAPDRRRPRTTAATAEMTRSPSPSIRAPMPSNYEPPVRDDRAIAGIERRRPRTTAATAEMTRSPSPSIRAPMPSNTNNAPREGGASRDDNERRAALASRLAVMVASNTAPPPPPPAPPAGASATVGSSWDNVEALYNSSFIDGIIPYESLRAVDADTRRRDRAAFLMREWEENPTRRQLGGLHSRDGRPDPYDTSGLAWSEDGHTLFVAADNGIYEFSVNLFGRRLFPSTTMR